MSGCQDAFPHMIAPFSMYQKSQSYVVCGGRAPLGINSGEEVPPHDSEDVRREAGSCGWDALERRSLADSSDLPLPPDHRSPARANEAVCGEALQRNVCHLILSSPMTDTALACDIPHSETVPHRC